MTVDTNPEFGIELALVLPYAYWLHTQGKLDKVITSKGMKPFYYFCDDVEEKYDNRTIDNHASGLGSGDNPIIPNCWIYGSIDNAKLYKDEWEHWESFSNVKAGCGILDYRKWKLPNFYKKYKNNKFTFKKPFIIISNRYNYEHGTPPVGYFNIKCLYEMFNYLTDRGYSVVYKRPKNTEFPLDQNELDTRNSKKELTAYVEGIGEINDIELVNFYDEVYLLDDIIDKHPDLTYNEVQLNLFGNAEGFIGMSGGSTLLLNLFNKPTITYLYNGSDLRDKFWVDENNNVNIKNYYYAMNDKVIPYMDRDCINMHNNNHTEFLLTIKQNFKGKDMKHDISVMTGLEIEETLKAEQYIKGKDKVLEWGSGGSTLYFPQMVNNYVSIEHDVIWYDKLKLDVPHNCEYHHVPMHSQRLDDMLDPQAEDAMLCAGDTELRDGITYWQTRGHFDWHCGIDYIKKPLSLEHQNYDVIFIDGRCRSMCAYLATHLLKDEGYVLVHDFIPRQYYHGLLKWYDVVDKAGTLIVLTKRKGELRNNEDVKILSQKLYNEWSIATGRIR